MNAKNIIISVLGVGLLISLGWLFAGPKDYIAGSVTGPDVQSNLNVYGVFAQGGGVYATSTTDTTEVFQATDLEYGVIYLTPNTNSTTYTLPATSTVRTVNLAKGLRRSVILCNATTTAAKTATLAAGTGWTIINATSTLAISPGDCGSLEFWSESDTDITGIFNSGN